MSGTYDELLRLPHHVSATRPSMAPMDRAAQFAPFAALSGYEAVIAETARQTEAPMELDASQKAALNRRLCFLRAHPERQAAITYFLPDAKKAGGTYVTLTDTLRRVDEHRRLLLTTGGVAIPADDVVAIDIKGDPQRQRDSAAAGTRD